MTSSVSSVEYKKAPLLFDRVVELIGVVESRLIGWAN